MPPSVTPALGTQFFLAVQFRFSQLRGASGRLLEGRPVTSPFCFYERDLNSAGEKTNNDRPASKRVSDFSWRHDSAASEARKHTGGAPCAR